MAIDWNFLAEREGANIPVGHAVVSKSGKVLGKSGVTVGTGFDIGAYSDSEIDHLQISAALKAKLKPFSAGKVKDVLALGSLLGANNYRWPASTLMQVKPIYLFESEDLLRPYSAPPRVELEPLLQLNNAELKELWVASQKQTSEAITRNYNRAVHQKGHQLLNFEMLAGQIQTAIVSFCFQFGENIGDTRFATDRRGTYWDAITSQEWPRAISVLDTLFPDYRDRRLREMRLFKNRSRLRHAVTINYRPEK